MAFKDFGIVDRFIRKLADFDFKSQYFLHK